MIRCKLKDVCEIIVPMRDKPKKFVEASSGIPWCRIEDIEGKFLSDSLSGKYVDKKCIQSMNLKIFPKGTVICAVTGASIGTYAITTTELITNQTFAGLVCGEKIYNEYLYYFIRCLTNFFKNNSVGCAQAYITRETLENIELDLPDLDKQKQIVSILKNIDDKIIRNNKINSLLESFSKTIYNYWFLQFEFPNEDGKPYKSSGGKMIWNEELKREIPEGWKVMNFGNIIFENLKSNIQVKNVVSGEGCIPFFTSGDKILFVKNDIVDGNNIFMNTGGNAGVKQYIGKAAYSTDTWCINAGHNTNYLYQYLLNIKEQLNISFFSGSGLKHLQKEVIKKHKILIPDKYVIDKFNKIVDLIVKMESKNKVNNVELSELRDFLLPLLMNGQVTFKDDK